MDVKDGNSYEVLMADEWPSADEIARQMASDGQHCVKWESFDDFWDGWWTTGFTMFVRKAR